MAEADGTRMELTEENYKDLREEFVELRKSQTLTETRLGQIENSIQNIEGLLQQMMKQTAASSSNLPPPPASDVQAQDMALIHEKGIKIEIPHFDGSDPEDWVFKIQEYFNLYNIPFDQRITLACLHMTGPAFAWYKWMLRNNFLFYSWSAFLEALLVRFGTNQLFDDPRAALKECRQQTSVAEYQLQYEEISSRVSGLSEAWLTSFFIAGLKDHLKLELLLAQPSSYFHAVSLAKMHEQKYLANSHLHQ